MRSLNDKISNYLFRWRLTIIICITVVFYVPYGILVFAAEEKVITQLLGSALHIFLLWLTIKHLYPREAPSTGYKYYLALVAAAILVINMLPFNQDYVPYDNGFVPLTVQFPQTNFGIPNIYLRVFTVDSEWLQNANIPPIIFYPASAFETAFVFGLLIAIFLRARYYFHDSASLWTPKNQD